MKETLSQRSYWFVVGKEGIGDIPLYIRTYVYVQHLFFLSRERGRENPLRDSIGYLIPSFLLRTSKRCRA